MSIGGNLKRVGVDMIFSTTNKQSRVGDFVKGVRERKHALQPFHLLSMLPGVRMDPSCLRQLQPQLEHLRVGRN
eukprot:4811306-Amphidinium_carterae.1